MRRVAVGGAWDGTPFHPAGELITFSPTSPQGFAYRSGDSFLEPDMAAYAGWREPDLVRGRRLVEFGVHSMIAVPMRARGAVLGVVTFWRSRRPERCGYGDGALAGARVARAGVRARNARRCARGLAMALPL